MSSRPRLRPLACALALGLAAFAGTALAEPDPADPFALLTERAAYPARAAEAAPVPHDTSLRGRVREAASDMVVSAMNFLGVPYKLGGTSAETGFDCSGFTRHVFENTLGLLLPRRADEQAHAPGLLKVDRHELKPGDLVFFNTLRRTFSHVGIYVGDGKFIHSPRSGAEVRVEDMRVAYWAQRFTGARRAEQASAPVVVASAGGLTPLESMAAVGSQLPAALVDTAPAEPAPLRATKTSAKAATKAARHAKAPVKHAKSARSTRASR